MNESISVSEIEAASAHALRLLIRVPAVPTTAFGNGGGRWSAEAMRRALEGLERRGVVVRRQVGLPGISGRPLTVYTHHRYNDLMVQFYRDHDEFMRNQLSMQYLASINDDGEDVRGEPVPVRVDVTGFRTSRPVAKPLESSNAM